MASLTGNTIASTYTGLLKTADNGTIDTTSKNITDGSGNATALSLSSTGVTVSGSLTLSGSLLVQAGATLDITASNAINSLTAITASYLSGSISNALSASYAQLAAVASYVDSNNVEGPYGADSVATASHAIIANTALTASYIDSANITGPLGTNSVTSTIYAQSASIADYALAAPDTVIGVSGSTIYTINPDTLNFNTQDCILLGDNAGTDATNANNSTFIGSIAGQGATNSDNSIFIGTSAGDQATDANASIFIGTTAGQNAFNADHSVFLGLEAGSNATNANESIFIGDSAGEAASNADHSILLGYQAGALGGGTNGIGSNNIIIGTNITLPDDATNSINVGGILFATGSYSDTGALNPFSGSVEGGMVGIGTSTPAATLDVSGSLNVTSGSITLPGLLLLDFADDTTAAAAGIQVGGLYRNGNVVSIRLT